LLLVTKHNSWYHKVWLLYYSY